MQRVLCSVVGFKNFLYSTFEIKFWRSAEKLRQIRTFAIISMGTQILSLSLLSKERFPAQITQHHAATSCAYERISFSLSHRIMNNI
jgi:hypothetical protein